MPLWRNLVYAVGLGPIGRKALEVQVLSGAPKFIKKNRVNSIFFVN